MQFLRVNSLHRVIFHNTLRNARFFRSVSTLAQEQTRTQTASLRRVTIFLREQHRQQQQQQQQHHAAGLLNINVKGLSTPLQMTRTFRPSDALRALSEVGASAGGDSDDPIVAACVNGVTVALNESIINSLERARSGSSGGEVLDLNFLRASEPEGALVYWHSAAHVIGAALEAHFGDAALLADGPAFLEGEGGFFYELVLTNGARVTPNSFGALETAAKALVSSRLPFERLELSRPIAAELFADNRLKLALLERIPSDQPISAFRCGPFVDLCRGPHVSHTGVFRALRLTRVGASHGGGSGDVDLMQRVYGYAAPSTRALATWQARLDEAARRDHRNVGKAQSLFFFHELSPGSAFLLPHGARIFNRLSELLRGEYRRRGYEEVATPLLYKKELWATSGHLEAYAENMFSVRGGGLNDSGSGGGCADHTHAALASAGSASDSGEEDESEVFGLKPMNCPGHCLIFAHRAVTYRDLPLRIADFSTLHRNEASGALGGLTRLRRFSQDDAHIFCTEEQIESEVLGCLDFVAAVYRLFGFSFRAVLATRPEKFVGDIATWVRAETALSAALRVFLAAGKELTVDEGGGAFYGPKVDVFVKDALGREHQCATVQLDFQLPRRFNLSYRGVGEIIGEGTTTLVGETRTITEGHASGVRHTPVMIHRAILGSLERMMGILIEHTGGKWPFWLSPRQVLVLTVADRHAVYATRVAERLRWGRRDTGLWVDVDSSTRTVAKKVREAQVEAHNVIVVVGDAEEAGDTVAVRFRDSAVEEDFFKAWEEVNKEGVGGRRGGGKRQGDGGVGVYVSPLVNMSVDQLRNVCEEMRAVRL
jgi:threonyl-tRNA synthetase